MEETIKEIKEKLIQPFYEFPNPTSIELKCNDIDLILDLIKEYQKIKMQLEVEKIDNKYNQEETHEETIPRYKIREIKEEYEKIEEIRRNFKGSNKYILKIDYTDIEYMFDYIEKQQKEIEKLKDEYKREVFEHQEFVEDTKVAVQDYIKKDEIKEKMRGEINKSWRNTEQRKCQLYAYDILKELLGE